MIGSKSSFPKSLPSFIVNIRTIFFASKSLPLFSKLGSFFSTSRSLLIIDIDARKRLTGANIQTDVSQTRLVFLSDISPPYNISSKGGSMAVKCLETPGLSSRVDPGDANGFGPIINRDWIVREITQSFGT